MLSGSRRNVLLIVVDQWRADCMPYLGTPHLHTPNLDRLCRAGVTFRNHVTTTVPCGPARAWWGWWRQMGRPCRGCGR